MTIYGVLMKRKSLPHKHFRYPMAKNFRLDEMPDVGALELYGPALICRYTSSGITVPS